MGKRRSCLLLSAVVLLSAHSAGQEKPTEGKPSLPKVVSASVPFYPELARQTHIEGTVALRVSTDGKRVSAIGAESGHPLLVSAATDNLNTWQFAPHVPATFEATFRYRLLDVKCGPQCKCESEEKESVVLRLPASVEVSAPNIMLCDPATERPGRHASKSQ